MSDLTQSIEDQGRQKMGIEFINCLAATGFVLWNNSGQPTDYPEKIHSHAVTSMSIDFLRNASDRMIEESYIKPPYVLVAPKAVIAGLKSEWYQRHRWVETGLAFAAMGIEATATMRSLSNHIEFSSPEPISVDCIGTVRGKCGDIVLVESDYFGVGAPGSLGVQRENVGGQLQVTTSSYLFGSEWLAHGMYPSCIELRTTAASSNAKSQQPF